MFTGLIQAVGTLEGTERTPDGARLTVGSALAGELRVGDSIAINGVCLTATGVGAERFSADVMEETLRRSSLGDARAGAGVNLELAARAADRLGGHLVQGHVDAVATVTGLRDEGFARVLTFSAPTELLRYVVLKGSVALDGVSLTTSVVDDDGFAVSLIPETLASTTLGIATVGTRVNLEVDLVAKYVEKLVGVAQ